MATNYTDFSNFDYQGRKYLIVYIDPQNLFYDDSVNKSLDDYGNTLSGLAKSDYTLPTGDEIGTSGEDLRNQNLLRDGTTPEKALATLPDDLRCPINPRTRSLSKTYLNNFASSSDVNGIPMSSYFDGNEYGVCYLIKRTPIYDSGYTNTERKSSVAASYDVPLYPHNDTYSAKTSKNEPYSLRNIMFLGCPKQTDDMYYILPDILKDQTNTSLWQKWVNSTAEYANIYVDITPDGYPNIIEDSTTNSTTIKVTSAGYNEFLIVKISDIYFQSLVMNRIYLYRKCYAAPWGTYGGVPIIDIRNDNESSKTNIVIDHCKFGFCELKAIVDGSITTWNDYHWTLEQDNWNTSELDNKRCRRFIKIRAAQYLKFNNNIINYSGCDVRGFDSNGHYQNTSKGAGSFSYPNSDRIYTYNNSNGNRTGWYAHYDMNGGSCDSGVDLGPYLLNAQVINNNINILTARAIQGRTTDNAYYVGRVCALIVNTDAKFSDTSMYNWLYKTSLELYNLTGKIIFNKCNTEENMIPEMLYVGYFNRQIVKNITMNFQKDPSTGEIIDAGSAVPGLLWKGRYASIDLRSGDQYDFENLDLSLERCWYFWNSGRILNIDIAFYLDGRSEPGKVAKISSISCYAANGDGDPTKSTEGYGSKLMNDTEYAICNFSVQRYNRIIISPITIKNYWGYSISTWGGQIPDNTCRLYGSAIFDCTTGTIEHIVSGKSGKVLNAYYGSVIRVKKIIVDNSSKTDTTPIVNNWPTDGRSFGGYRAVTYYIDNNWRWGSNVVSNADNLRWVSNTSEAFIENGAYILIDRCNKLIISTINFQSTSPGDNCYGITCLNENDRTFTLTTLDSAIGNGRYVQYTKNYYTEPYSIRRVNGSQASLQVTNTCSHDYATEFVLGKKPFRGIQVACKDSDDNYLPAGKYKLELYFALKNWKLSSFDDNQIENYNTNNILDETSDSYAYDYIFNDIKRRVNWEACLSSTLDDGTVYEKEYTTGSDGYYEMKTYDDHTSDTESEEYDWEWIGDQFKNSDDYRFKSTIIVEITDSTKPINCRIHIRYYNALGGTLYVDPAIKIKSI